MALPESISQCFDVSFDSPSDQDAKFFSSVTANQIPFAASSLHDVDHADKNLVADNVTKAIIDTLEVIRVEHEEGQSSVLAAGIMKRQLRLREKGSSVQASGQRIACCQALQLLVLL